MPRPKNFPLAQPVFDEPVFSEGQPTPDPNRFRVAHPSDAQVYQQIQSLLSLDVVDFPASRLPPSAAYSLASAWGAHGDEIVQQIGSSGKVVFHMVGDTGASVQGHYPGELHVADQVTAESHSAISADRASFLYILGDLVYDFGEAQYYYDQFYEPYRDYPAPIFAIPGNHDSFTLPGTPTGGAPLDTFQRNFCAPAPGVTPEAGSLHRTAMCQPGVYFALDAPFVRIIGLFSNALEDPGVISSEGGKWPTVPNYQLDFLRAQLQAIKNTAYPGAVLLATHHPGFTYSPPTTAPGRGGLHAANPTMLRDIDAVCASVGVYPHAFLAGHAHNYQRYTRKVQVGAAQYSVPFIVCGGGGHGVSPLVRARLGTAPAEPAEPSDVSYLDARPAIPARGLTLERYDDQQYGYLRVTVDARRLQFDFFGIGPGGTAVPTDSTTVDLATHAVSTGSTSAPARSRGGSPARARRAAGRSNPRRP